MSKILLSFLFVTIAIASYACEFCGCGVGNFYLGILPQFSKNFVGARYQAQRFNSHVGLHPSLATSEYFQSTEMWGRFYPIPRLQVMTMVTYHVNKQATTSGNIYLEGLGDIPLLVNYNLINTTRDDDDHLVNHDLWVGGGSKLPTGKYKFQESPTEVANANFQLGTGSLDFFMNGLYTLRYKRVGVNADVTYKMNTYNSEQYRFGNKFNGSVSFVFIQQIGTLGVMPSAGMYIEDSAQNKSVSITIADSGGSAAFTTAGLQLYWGKISVGGSYRTPVSQNLANGRIKAHDRVMLHTTFLF
jgi:hypothetical protein